MLSIREQPIKVTFMTDSAEMAPPVLCTQVQALFTWHRQVEMGRAGREMSDV